MKRQVEYSGFMILLSVTTQVDSISILMTRPPSGPIHSFHCPEITKFIPATKEHVVSTK